MSVISGHGSYHSKCPEVFPMKMISTEDVLQILKQVFGRFGTPKVVVSDNGTQLVSKKIGEFFDEFQIEHRRVALHGPNKTD